MKNQKIIQKIINYIDSVLKYTSNITYDEFQSNSKKHACLI